MDKHILKNNVNLEATAKPVVCECGNEIFAQGLRLKEVSAIMSPTGQKQIMAIPTLYCTKCFKEYKETENE